MPYLLQFDDETAASYLVRLNLSREGRITLAKVFHDIRLYADRYIDSPELRLYPGSDCFRVDTLFRDSTSGLLHLLRLVISDAAAQYGILRVVFIEVESEVSGL